MKQEARILSVSQLNTYVKMLFDSDEVLQSVWVRGEISNFKRQYTTGHLYFSVKDEEASVSCAMFRSAAAGLRFQPADGMKVLLRGRVSLYPRTGQYQVYVEEMQPDGLGSLALAYEQLRRKLEGEGLFRADRKKPIPAFPERVGVITSASGAAIHDIITVTGRRCPSCRIILHPAQVQGPEAPAQLVEALRFFNESCPVDVIILGRGGGSIEDLWAFNNETLARAVAASRIPVISAVGHESDTTICDYAADLRAATPSAAAELAVPDTRELTAVLGDTEARMETALLQRVQTARERLRAFENHRLLTSPVYLVVERRQALQHITERIHRAQDRILEIERQRIGRVGAVLQGLSPLAVLGRGYAAVQTKNGRIVTSVTQTQTGDGIAVRLRDGVVQATVTKVQIASEGERHADEKERV